MKHKLLTGLSALMLAITLMLASGFTGADQIAYAADTASEPRLVSVYGEGEVLVTPDHATVNLGVETQDPDAAVAQDENAKIMSAVIEAIKKMGINSDAIQTTGYDLYQTYDYDYYYDDYDSDYEYYVASNTVTVEMDDIDMVGELIDAASKAGANSINSVHFSVKDDSKYYQQALELAMKDAKSKATAIMKTFNKVPSLPYSVSEYSYGGGSYYDYSLSARSAEMSSEYTTPIEAGEISIYAEVGVSYDY